MIVTEVFAKLVELLQDAVSISIEIEKVAFDPNAMDFSADKVTINIGGANDTVIDGTKK